MSFHPNRSRMLALAAWFGILCIMTGFGRSAWSAEEGAPEPAAVIGEAFPESSLPSEYGEVIYHREGWNPRQIYIIGQSHRSGSTGRNGADTVQVQTEIYRIGEHLIRKNDIELLLPEGFFQRVTTGSISSVGLRREGAGYDNQTLSSMLRAEDRFVNADMLLNNSYNIRLAQVEDEEIYQDVRRLLQQGLEEDRLSLLARLDSMQEKRSAVMLQNVAEVVEQAYRQGNISSPRAIFTIGLAHVDEIIAFLKEGMIRLDETGGDGDHKEQLKLLEQGYGVTVIIPRTLADNEEALRLARLDLD